MGAQVTPRTFGVLLRYQALGGTSAHSTTRLLTYASADLDRVQEMRAQPATVAAWHVEARSREEAVARVLAHLALDTSATGMLGNVRRLPTGRHATEAAS